MKNKIVILLTSMILGLLGLVSVCNAATILTDNFNSYSDGDINGQGGWTVPTTDEYFTVQSGVVNEGAKAIKSNTILTGFDIGIKKTGILLADGSFTIYVRAETAASDGMIRLFETPTGPENPKVLIEFTANGFSYKDSSGNKIGFGPDTTLNTWYAIQVQWRNSDHKVRYNINGGTWTLWVPAAEAWISGIGTVNLERRAGADNIIYFDTIQENENPPKNPVLIVPGLMGTEMYKGDEKLWLDLGRNFIDIRDKFMDPLSFDSSINPSNSVVSFSNMIRTEKLPGYTFDYTAGLINEFKNQGYIENETLFTFPYDWRYGASGKFTDGRTNADLLAQKIQDILAKTGGDKVDIVAHSEGGLIVKKYVVDHPGDHHIGKAIFVGVPNTGAPRAIKVLLQGDNFGIPWLSQAEIKKIAENLPVAYDLVPSQQYYDTKGSFVRVIDEGLLTSFTDDTQKDLNYQDFENFLTNDHSLNSQALTGAQTLHTTDFDNVDLRADGIDLYSINGCKTGTIGKIIENRYKNILGQNFVEYKSPKFTPGDNTVPLESATNLPIDQNHKFYFLTADHSKMLSQDGSRQEIVNIISGSSLDVKSNLITQDINICSLNGKAISVFSPIDIFVTDQNGNHLGIADDGSIVNEIPNADFEIFDDHKFLYLSTDNGQIYTVAIRGTGTGTFTIHAQDITNDQVAKTEIFSNLPVTPQLSGQINIGNSGSPTNITIKERPTSSNTTISASAVLDESTSEDFVRPTSVATIKGSLNKNGVYTDHVTIAIRAKDPVLSGNEHTTSGIFDIEYNLNNTGFRKNLGEAATITISKRGSHVLSFFSVDKAGNNEAPQTIYITVRKSESEQRK